MKVSERRSSFDGIVVLLCVEQIIVQNIVVVVADRVDLIVYHESHVRVAQVDCARVEHPAQAVVLDLKALVITKLAKTLNMLPFRILLRFKVKT